MYCCCQRPHLKARSSDRTKRLKHSELRQCGSCATWNYAVCHGVELNNNKESWYCSDCQQLPILPAWSPIEQ
uniref:Uncharacterized protein n=1 Tax=Panagrolaimus davidi TaxID=227884 RepID=A0A914Q906_9BILA